MNKTLGFLLLGGGGAWLAYQFGLLCPFGIGPSCAAPAAAPPPTPTGTAPPPGGGAPPAPPTTTPTPPAPGSTSFQLVGPVAPDINNSIKGQVLINGKTFTLNCMSDGTVYNAAQLPAGVDQSAICTAMQNLLQAQTVVVAADIPTCAALPRAITSYTGMTDPQSVLRLAQLQAALSKCPKTGTSGLGLAGPRRRSLYGIRGASRINYRRIA